MAPSKRFRSYSRGNNTSVSAVDAFNILFAKNLTQRKLSVKKVKAKKLEIKELPQKIKTTILNDDSLCLRVNINDTFDKLLKPPIQPSSTSLNNGSNSRNNLTGLMKDSLIIKSDFGTVKHSTPMVRKLRSFKSSSSNIVQKNSWFEQSTGPGEAITNSLEVETSSLIKRPNNSRKAKSNCNSNRTSPVRLRSQTSSVNSSKEVSTKNCTDPFKNPKDLSISAIAKNNSLLIPNFASEKGLVHSSTPLMPKGGPRLHIQPISPINTQADNQGKVESCILESLNDIRSWNKSLPDTSDKVEGAPQDSSTQKNRTFDLHEFERIVSQLSAISGQSKTKSYSMENFEKFHKTFMEGDKNKNSKSISVSEFERFYESCVKSDKASFFDSCRRLGFVTHRKHKIHRTFKDLVVVLDKQIFNISNKIKPNYPELKQLTVNLTKVALKSPWPKSKTCFKAKDKLKKQKYQVCKKFSSNWDRSGSFKSAKCVNVSTGSRESTRMSTGTNSKNASKPQTTKTSSLENSRTKKTQSLNASKSDIFDSSQQSNESPSKPYISQILTDSIINESPCISPNAFVNKRRPRKNEEKHYIAQDYSNIIFKTPEKDETNKIRPESIISPDLFESFNSDGNNSKLSSTPRSQIKIVISRSDCDDNCNSQLSRLTRQSARAKTADYSGIFSNSSHKKLHKTKDDSCQNVCLRSGKSRVTDLTDSYRVTRSGPSEHRKSRNVSFLEVESPRVTRSGPLEVSKSKNESFLDGDSHRVTRSGRLEISKSGNESLLDDESHGITRSGRSQNSKSRNESYLDDDSHRVTRSGRLEISKSGNESLLNDESHGITRSGRLEFSKSRNESFFDDESHGITRSGRLQVSKSRNDSFLDDESHRITRSGRSQNSKSRNESFLDDESHGITRSGRLEFSKSRNESFFDESHGITRSGRSQNSKSRNESFLDDESHRVTRSGRLQISNSRNESFLDDESHGITRSGRSQNSKSRNESFLDDESHRVTRSGRLQISNSRNESLLDDESHGITRSGRSQNSKSRNESFLDDESHRVTRSGRLQISNSRNESLLDDESPGLTRSSRLQNSKSRIESFLENDTLSKNESILSSHRLTRSTSHSDLSNRSKKLVILVDSFTSVSDTSVSDTPVKGVATRSKKKSEDSFILLDTPDSISSRISDHTPRRSTRIRRSLTFAEPDLDSTASTLQNVSSRSSGVDETLSKKSLLEDTWTSPGVPVDNFKVPALPNFKPKPGKAWRRSLMQQKRESIWERSGRESVLGSKLNGTVTRPRSSIGYGTPPENKTRMSIKIVPNNEENRVRRRTDLQNYVYSEVLSQDVTNKISLPKKLSLPKVTARDMVLKYCHQVEPVPFEKAYPNSLLQNCKKIGEGVYGEVFLHTQPGGNTTVMKIIPIEGNQIINGERQKKFHEILSEVAIVSELSNLKNNVYNKTTGFCEVQRITCVKGKYPNVLIDHWEEYDKNIGSENDPPDIFKDDQLYVVLDLGNGGQDLEAFVFNNAVQAVSMFKQVSYTLAIAEEELQFEHRDLHWGNVLLRRVARNRKISFKHKGKVKSYQTEGVEATIIDFTLSRMTHDDIVIFNDLGQDPDLFQADGDYQFEVYRLMKKRNCNDWKKFTPYTNVLWLNYILDKSITALRYNNTKTKTHKKGLKILKEFKECLLEHESATEFVRKRL